MRAPAVEAGWLRRWAPALVPLEEGVWTAGRSTPVSYPGDGHVLCRAVEDGSFWFQHRNRCIVDAVRAWPPRGPLVDAGGGNGYVAAGLRDAGIPTLVVEPGLDGARQARARGLEPVVCATLEDAGFRPHSLPALGFFDVIEHVEEDVRLLEQARELLEEDGRLYLTVPAFSWLWAEDDVVAGHFRRYARAPLCDLLRRTGFAVDFASYLFAPLPLPLWLLRAVPSRLGLRSEGAVRARQDAEHGARGGVASAALRAVLSAERAWLRRGGSLPLGTSLLVVAHVEGR
ncbi:class I SAM-dependent methyltransferase [Corallococcus llansteffanensis]|uniref:Methyltransferase domain-containing protein n=1 Tax=Corallococcus llansteffanensis TaxID=2316731 RepID=A0A3A8N4B2_9BACT|nr:methyltransferase domain-containing protein [Corallococcus llansteffanensis]RKH38350.1 methyltransferase domain-containing protein [Corallococcus llansteffanensis]